MTESEAVEAIQFDLKIGGEIHSQVLLDAIDVAIQALEAIKRLSDRKMTTEVLENYMQFEDECVKKGFTFKSVIEAREKQIPKKPIMKQYFKDMEEKYLCCPTCGEILTDRIPGDNKTFYLHCMNCGQKLDWSDENADSES